MAVEFVRSCVEGYWRFFPGAPDTLTRGRLYFVPPDTPHFPTPHFFGTDFWRQDRHNTPIGFRPFEFGHDSTLPWSWDRGTAPEVAPRETFVGDLAAAGDDTLTPPTPPPRLMYGMDERCFRRPCGQLPLSDYIEEFPLDDGALLLVLAGLLQKLWPDQDYAGVTQALETWLGPGRIAFSATDIDNPPICAYATPRNNLLLIFGTHNNYLLSKEITAGLNGPTNYGAFSTLPIWFDFSTRALDTLESVNPDPTLTTYIVGHSLGAATAAVVNARLDQSGAIQERRLVLFNPPKPGDRRLADITEKTKYVALWNEGDITPAIPPTTTLYLPVIIVFPWLPRIWFTSWKPLARYLYLDPNGDLTYGGPAPQEPVETIGWLTAIFVSGAEGPIEPHYLPAIIRRLDLIYGKAACPFTDTFFAVLFGDSIQGEGGAVLSGEGAVNVPKKTGVILDGAGLVFASTPAKIRLDGAGLVVGPPALVAGVRLDGAGQLAAGTAAGLVLDGAGVADVTSASGLVLDGAGLVAVGTTAGVRLDGAGLVAVGTTAGVRLDGAGLIAAPPAQIAGVRLDGAGLVAVGTTAGVRLDGAGLVAVGTAAGLVLDGAGLVVTSPPTVAGVRLDGAGGMPDGFRFGVMFNGAGLVVEGGIAGVRLDGAGLVAVGTAAGVRLDGAGVITAPTAGGFMSIAGLAMSLDPAPHALDFAAGLALDSTRAQTLTLAAGLVVNLNILNAAAGVEGFQGAGTITTSATVANCAGTGTAFLTAFGTRAIAGTATSAGAAVTGTGTHFLSDVAVGDLIGNPASGYWQVIAIATDTNLTLYAAPGTALAGAVNVIESPTLSPTNSPAYGSNVFQVVKIASNASLDLAAPSVNATTNYYIGIPAAQHLTQPQTGASFAYPFLVNGSSGTTVIVSTQRTRPYVSGFGTCPPLAGYSSLFRRIGSVLIDTTGTPAPFVQTGSNSDRRMQFEFAAQALGSRLVNGGVSGGWTRTTAAGLAPPATRRIICNAIVTGTAGNNAVMRASNQGAATGGRNLQLVCDAAAGTAIPVDIATDKAQAVDWTTMAGINFYLDLIGYVETLE
jgi:hypothetical protein